MAGVSKHAGGSLFCGDNLRSGEACTKHRLEHLLCARARTTGAATPSPTIFMAAVSPFGRR